MLKQFLTTLFCGWVLWQADKGAVFTPHAPSWEAVRGYETLAACEQAATERQESYNRVFRMALDMEKSPSIVTFTCFSDSFDPREKPKD